MPPGTPGSVCEAIRSPGPGCGEYQNTVPVGLLDQRPGDRHSLLLTAGQLRWQVAGRWLRPTLSSAAVVRLRRSAALIPLRISAA